MAAENSEVLVEPGPRAQARVDALVDAVLASRPLDVVSGTFVRAGGPLDRALRRSGRLHTVAEDVSPIARLRGEEDWDTFHSSLSGSQRKTDRKRRRRLESRGVVTAEVLLAGDPQAPAVLDWLLDQKQAWGARVGKNGAWLSDPGYRVLWRGLVGVAGRLPVQVFVLRLDGVPVAGQVAVVGSRHLDLVIAGFDDAHQDVSPGAALSAEVVRWAWEHDLDVEFGNGAEPYKLFWCRGHAVPTHTVSLPVSRWGAFGLAAQRQVGRIRN